MHAHLNDMETNGENMYKEYTRGPNSKCNSYWVLVYINVKKEYQQIPSPSLLQEYQVLRQSIVIEIVEP